MSLDLQTDHVFHRRKRSRSEANPAYVLNLECPGSFYDLTFESSKTIAQFKVILVLQTLVHLFIFCPLFGMEYFCFITF